MDAFESIIADILRREGYWVQASYKVDVTKKEKRQVGRPSIPRPEVDLVAYRPAANELLVIECKSFLDSPGVRYTGVAGSSKDAKRYKLFNDARLRGVITRRLVRQLTANGLCLTRPRVRLCLAAGKICSVHDRLRLRDLFKARGWCLFDEEWIYERLTQIREMRYENDVACVVAKILLRYRPSPLQGNAMGKG